MHTQMRTNYLFHNIIYIIFITIMQPRAQSQLQIDPKLAAAFEVQLRRHWNIDRVAALLRRHIAREQKTWRVRKFAAHTSSSTSEEISGVQRDYTVRWFSTVSTGFGLPREVLFLATALLDEFLQVVRAKPRFLQVIACSCFFLAAKVTLDDDAVPTLADLIRSGGCECSVSEVRRMEKVILDRLHWDLNRATTLDFLHAYHALLENNCESVLGPEGPRRVASLKVLWETKLQLLLANNTVLASERPSIVALALVSLEMEALSTHWLLITVALQALADVGSPENVIRCREQVSRHLQLSQSQLLAQRRQASKRKMQPVDDEEQDCIYDSIKKLYANDSYENSAASNSNHSGHPSGMTVAQQAAANKPAIPVV
ncbi:cyclin-I-like isoform X1 [Varroa jacobsoni]|uniref:Cyclin-like domain-containing protein n=1 Tax=Varroa destructor TaxID=109461 RepID=A0A7M7JAU5_VARDE|nr:cyclin-I-like isoform X2 [Varroa destructor]XP_022686316.1 cyclin-I-like isoform X1 [Varroa jacobsoni]